MTIDYLVMAKYRRRMDKIKQKHIIDKYKKHCDVEGGIFRSDKRRKLVGLKKKNPKQIEEGTADFWYDVRNSVRHALTDFQLVAEVSSHEQLKEMFDLIPYGKWKKDISKTSIPILLKAILSSQPTYSIRFKKGQPYPIENKEDDVWLAHLAYETVRICFDFFKEHNLITSMAHERLIEETDDMLNSEIGRAWFVPRERRNIKF